MNVPIAISARHLHVTREDLDILFGKGYELTKLKDINQPGQYASNERVTLKTDNFTKKGVRILGPIRPYTQVEISKTDAHSFRINPPVRMSGDLEESETIEIIGPKGSIVRENCCIIAARHIHVDDITKEKYKLVDGETVSVKVNSEKSAILGNVIIKTSPNYYYEMHIDTDDANANLIKNNDIVEIIR